MRILHLGKYYAPERGGIESYTRALCEWSVARGHALAALVHQRPRTWRTTRENIGGVEVRRVACLGAPVYTPLSPTFPLELSRALRELAPDSFICTCRTRPASPRWRIRGQNVCRGSCTGIPTFRTMRRTGGFASAIARTGRSSRRLLKRATRDRRDVAGVSRCERRACTVAREDARDSARRRRCPARIATPRFLARCGARCVCSRSAGSATTKVFDVLIDALAAATGAQPAARRRRRMRAGVARARGRARRHVARAFHRRARR